MILLQTEGLVEVAVEPGGQEAGGRVADAADEVQGEDLATEEFARGGKPDEGRSIGPRGDLAHHFHR